MSDINDDDVMTKIVRQLTVTKKANEITSEY